VIKKGKGFYLNKDFLDSSPPLDIWGELLETNLASYQQQGWKGLGLLWQTWPLAEPELGT
jgi:hypothetical protein